MSYESWTRDQLLEKINQLETQLSQHNAQEYNKSQETNECKRNRHQERPFDMTKYTQRRVALRIAYLGWEYFGFAAQGREDKVPTVEGQLIKALKACRLIENEDTCQLSRCGRTDKGVSGLGQVVSVNVRSKQLATNMSHEHLDPMDEIPYAETLNRLLPNDIRVLSWAPVEPNFDARFDCKSRTYRYFFLQDGLDIELMTQATKYFVGEHDFRNFCKLDPSKNISSYKRCVLYMTITPCDVSPFYCLELKGTAFLWHQVRCIMAILFLVGQGLESPTIVQDLLDISKVASRPDYAMASELPLLLYDCEFTGLKWVRESKSPNHSASTLQHWQTIWYAQMTRALLCKTFFEWTPNDTQVQPILERKRPSDSIIILGGGSTMKSGRYKALLERPRCDSDEVKKAKYLAKRQKKMQNP